MLSLCVMEYAHRSATVIPRERFSDLPVIGELPEASTYCAV